MGDDFALDGPVSPSISQWGQSGEECLREFTTALFGHLPRVDQHRWAQLYLEALLATPGKKSVRRLAATVSNSAATAQSLRNFLNSSPWEWDPVMRELSAWTARRGPVRAWSIGTALLPKRGDRSAGVHQHFDSHSGRTLNCQVAVGAFLCVGRAHVPVDWRLFMPFSWTNDLIRRQMARIPDSEGHRPLWAQALATVDGLAESSEPVPVVADIGSSPDVRHLVQGLSRRGYAAVVRVPERIKVIPFERGSGLPGLTTAKACLSKGTVADIDVPLSGGPGRQRVRVRSAPVRLPGVEDGVSARSDLQYQLFTESEPGNRDGAVWITTLPRRVLVEAVELSGLAAGTVDAVAVMGSSLGLMDFEGRSYPGWYHHMALVSAAYAFRSLGGGSAPFGEGASACGRGTPAVELDAECG
nr:transposase [Streptomyces sp. QL37]